MGRFINIRNIYKHIEQHKLICYGYFRHILRTYQLQQYFEHHLDFFVGATSTYIFTPIHNKSLKNNKCLHVIEYAKPKHIETLKDGPYYRQIGVDKYEGPYWYGEGDDNAYKLDVTYYQWQEIYSVTLQKILSECNHLKLHEYIAYNAWKWGHKFISFWKRICNKVSSNISYGWVIFVDNKYILISWLAEDIALFAYPGYESLIATCGGKEINVKFKYRLARMNHPASKLVFINNTMWYVSNGESYELVSTSQSNIEKLFAIECHKKLVVERQLHLEKLEVEKKLHDERKQNSLYRLHLGLKKIRRDLKLNQYGEKFHFGKQVGFDVWFNYLQTILQNLNIVIESKAYTHRWTMLIAEANIAFCYQNATYFQRNYDNTQKDIVYLSKMEFSMNTKSGYLRIDGIILKRNEDGLIQGMNSRDFPPGAKDYYSLDTVINDSIFYNVLEFLDHKELVSLRYVSMKFAVYGGLKLLKMKHGEFVSTLN